MKFRILLNFQKTSKNDGILQKIKKCSNNDKITFGTVLKIWDIIFFIKATLVITRWLMLTIWGNQNCVKSWILRKNHDFTKFWFPQIVNISQRVWTKVAWVNNMISQLFKTVSSVILSLSEHFFILCKIASFLRVFWKSN